MSSRTRPVAPGPTSMPNQVPLEVEVDENWMGAAGVPSATRVPWTTSSPRLVAVPAPMTSELAENCER
ncbi:MAG: hypothetical protein HS111_32530 [Kofleriaceae bacterium]|nr:hypothetical protein [Kofleriaceae bacterium]